MSQAEDIMMREVERLQEDEAFATIISDLFPAYADMLAVVAMAGTPMDQREPQRSDRELAAQYAEHYARAEDVVKRFVHQHAAPEVLEVFPMLPHVLARATHESMYGVSAALILDKKPHHAALYEAGEDRLSRAFPNLQESAQQQAADFLSGILASRKGLSKS